MTLCNGDDEVFAFSPEDYDIVPLCYRITGNGTVYIVWKMKSFRSRYSEKLSTSSVGGSVLNIMYKKRCTTVYDTTAVRILMFNRAFGDLQSHLKQNYITLGSVYPFMSRG